MRALWIVAVLAAACEPATPAPAPAPMRPAVAPVAPAPIAPPVAPAPHEERELPADICALRAGIFPAADAAPGRRVAHKTAVLLIIPARNAWRDDEQFDNDVPPGPQRFIPIACSIDGVLVTGEKCGEVMPARTTIRVPSGELAVARSTTTFHDVRGDDTPAPYGPACCNYNACRGKTIAYIPVRSNKPLDAHTTLGVWPADADIGLEVAGPGISGIAASDLPHVASGEPVTQAFARGTRRYAATGPANDGPILWDLGHGWVNAATPGFAHSDALLATVDLVHDGRLTLIGYELWANDYGIDVFTEAVATPAYTYSCGNI